MTETKPAAPPPLRLPRLSCAAVDEQPVDFDWGEGYGETWDVVYPDLSGLSLAELKDYAERKGLSLPEDNNPWSEDMTAGDLLEELGVDPTEAYRVHWRCPDCRVEWSELGGGPGTDYCPNDACANSDALEPVRVEPADPDKADLLAMTIEQLRERWAAELNEDEDVLEDWREHLAEQLQGSADAYAPMMNYYYPVPGLEDAGGAQLALDRVRTCCVVALVHDEPVLALAGGGMNLSADICRAYVALGYLPPAWLCPPELFFRDKRAEEMKSGDVELLAYCRRSLEVVVEQARYQLDKLDQQYPGLPPVEWE